MKLVYADMQPATGEHTAGICSIYVTPKHWLAGDPVIDFETGKILAAVELQPNKFWIKIDLIDRSYTFSEQLKDSKSGPYTESTMIGSLNYYSFDLRQQLETLRRCQLVVMLTDVNKRRRIIGNAEYGMILNYAHQVNNPQGPEETVQVNMIMESEDPAPFYNPDGEPEIIYNLLQDIDGNFLLIG